MGCLLPGHFCTDHFRLRRQLLWTFLQKSASFRGYFSESSRQNLSGRRPLNQQCMNLFQTETGGLQVRKKYFWLVCCTAKMIDKDSGAVVFPWNWNIFRIKFVLLWAKWLSAIETYIWEKNGVKANKLNLNAVQSTLIFARAESFL